MITTRDIFRLVVGALTLWVGLWGGALAPAWGQALDEQPDVRVMVDVSGSMKEHDPERLAVSAIELLVALLPSGVSAGVWTFGEEVANPLPLGEVGEEWRDQALALPPALQAYQQYTDIETALRRAAAPEASGWRHLILLTDGVIDLPPGRGDKPAIDVASRRRLVEELAPELARQGVAVHAIAFSDEADLALVERLAQVSGGLAAVVASPEALLGAFLDIIERIFPADQVPLENGRFVIDDEVGSFSALVFHAPGDAPLSLVAPDGTRYRAEDASEALRWQVEPRFDLIRRTDPAAGEWRLEGPVGDKSRINVSSPVHLRTSPLPATLYRGFEVPVEAWVEKDDGPTSALPEALSLSVSLRDQDGEVQSSMELTATQDGRFRGRLPAPALTGNASLVIRARGEGFDRQRVQAVNVLPAIEVAHDARLGRVELVAEHPGLDADNTEIRAELLGEPLTAEVAGRARWHIVLPELDPDVRQPLRLTARVTLGGETRELSFPPLMLNPEGRIGIAQTDLADPTLTAESLAGDAEDSHRRPAVPNAADRFVELVNAAPRQVLAWWEAGLPGLTRLLRDPRLWAVVALCLLPLLVLPWVRRRRSSPTHKREEPHV
ncbi:vWA domain-containing protein [Halomonas cerina]|uniref:VWFA domain-containing protein n=1 Tax=Halomonas cerina TaxID=447424 RepID=A0A839V9A0_9GAMM|nr:vWA domain-containing protein [Halomonas cerina]MBB3189284.1 hypothetical protein [Halomonas cerina]